MRAHSRGRIAPCGRQYGRRSAAYAGSRLQIAVHSPCGRARRACGRAAPQRAATCGRGCARTRERLRFRREQPEARAPSPLRIRRGCTRALRWNRAAVRWQGERGGGGSFDPREILSVWGCGQAPSFPRRVIAREFVSIGPAPSPSWEARGMECRPAQPSSIARRRKAPALALRRSVVAVSRPGPRFS